MGFEATNGDGWNGTQVSPGGHIFGIEGFTFGQPVPKSITFFLDGSAMVCDQYGRCIRRATTETGIELRFADSPPEANREGLIVARPQFATHQQVVDALTAEKIDWLAYEVRWCDKTNAQKRKGGMNQETAGKLQMQLLKEGCNMVMVERTISCAGWPQLSYDVLKKMPEVPVTPLEELRKIRNPQARKDAMRLRREVDAVWQKEMAVATEE